MTKLNSFPSFIDKSAAQALVEGRHSDPFSILGPHAFKGETFITAFDPGADRMEAEFANDVFELSPVPGVPGVFAGVARSGSYRLRGHKGDTSWLMEDPYQFGPVIGEQDEYFLGEGSHQRIWKVLGAHVMEHGGVQGTHFAVWAPNAKRVSLVGDFNAWDGRRHPMRLRGQTGVWEIFMPGVGDGANYKFELLGANDQVLPQKADPVGFGSQHPPQTASVVRDIGGYGWNDAAWMQSRPQRNSRNAPISIYEVHLGSWRRKVDEGDRSFSYKEAALELVDYAHDMGFTHLELLPISEYPFDGSWGYQPVGLFAPTIRFGPPHEFRDLVEAAHEKGIGVILDWVPGHFPSDEHGLARFDGSHLYEHADPREGFHQDWNTLIYNYGRVEVANFLISNALYWLEEFHIDGLRVDAVASMLYRDYSRKEGEWVPNVHGGRENLEAISLLKRMNETVYGAQAGVMTVAEESTSFPQVSHPVDSGGLGFGFKWNMGWMNDTLEYIKRDPIYRQHHHHQMTFGLHYAFSENFVLPISHDEVVHGKGSMLQRMPGNEWERFANLRAYYGFMWTHPGKKLLFMGCEFAQSSEWNHNGQLEWHLLDYSYHAGVQRLIRDLNQLYRETPALFSKDCEADGFQWLEANAGDMSVYAWVRRGQDTDSPAIIICNFTPVERSGLKIGFPHGGSWREALNTDAEIYGGGNRGNLGSINVSEVSHQGQPFSADVTVPPLSTLVFVPE